MKKNMRNALAISGLALAIGASGLTLTASANTLNKSLNLKRSTHEKIVRVKKVEQTKKLVNIHRTFTGTASALSDNSFTLTHGSKTYQVNIDSNTRLLNRNWKTISFSDIKDGHKIRLKGTLSGTTLTAKTLRDISLPAQQ